MSNEITQADRELLEQHLSAYAPEARGQFLPLKCAALRAIAAARRQAEEAQQVCGEAYQVVGCLLSDTGQFDTEHGQNVLDNLSQHKMVHDNVLPWDSKPCVPCGREAVYGLFRAIVDAGGPQTIAAYGVERGASEWCSKVRAGLLAIERQHHPERFDEPLTAPPSAPDRDAYEGARDDLLDWKARAQRAEATLRSLGYRGIDASEPPSAPVGVEGPLSVFSAGEWKYSETGQTFSAKDLDEAAFVVYRDHLAQQPTPSPDVRLMVERVRRLVGDMRGTSMSWTKADKALSFYAEAIDAVLAPFTAAQQPTKK